MSTDAQSMSAVSQQLGAGHCYRAADFEDIMPLHGPDPPMHHTAFARCDEVLVDGLV